MARNMVQFQKGMSEARFDELYGTEELCHAALAQWRWPGGFACPDCESGDHCVVRRGEHGLYQCNACRKQTSVKAGTVFAASKLPLRTWFRGMYHLTQSKQGISSIELARRLGVTQTTAWILKHKLAQVMFERNATKRLTGKVQMDDSYMGGSRPGRRGRGAAGKTPFVAAVATTNEGKPDQIVLRRVAGFRKIAIGKLASTALSADGRSHLRRARLLRRRHGRWLQACAARHRRRAEIGEKTRVQMGQHHARQHQGVDRRHLQGRARKARAEISRRI